MFIDTLKQVPSEIWHNSESTPYLYALLILTLVLFASVAFRKVNKI